MLCAPCLCREDGDAAPAMRNCSESLRDFVQEEGDASRARSMQEVGNAVRALSMQRGW